MTYKNKEPKLIMFNEFYVHDCKLSKQTEYDYTCTSRSKFKEEKGLCCSYDCPLVCEANLTELKKYDDHLYQQYLLEFSDELKRGIKERDCFPSQKGSYWVIEYKEIV